jgi:hypothetical protein
MFNKARRCHQLPCGAPDDWLTRIGCLGESTATTVGDMPKRPSSQYGLKAQEDIDQRGIKVTNGPMR